jgi:lauroyl/myristoyl acyltransferase
MSGVAGPLRHRLETNWRAAGLRPDRQHVDRFFRLLGEWLGSTAEVLQVGFAQSTCRELFQLDSSCQVLEQALSQGRGAILVGFHYHGHELACARVAEQFPLAAIVRENKDPRRNQLKRRWYQALGIKTVWRGRSKGTGLLEAIDVVSVLRDNRVLALTPDLLVGQGSGVEVEFFGRRITLPAGLMSIAVGWGCPVVYSWPSWQVDTQGPSTFRLRFEMAPRYSKRGNRRETYQRGMAEWVAAWETHLRKAPEIWQFWLDKRWSGVWHRS